MHHGTRWHRVPATPYENWIMGGDPGQLVDYTAINIMHHTRTPLDDWDVREDIGRIAQKVDERFDIVDLKRLPLGMLYPDQVDYIQSALARLRHPCDLVLDATSNFAVADECQKRGLKPVRIVFTSGAEVTKLGFRKFGVPKSRLVGNVDARLNSNELHFAKDLIEGEVLEDEFGAFHSHVSTAGKNIYEARSGRHDDIIFCIACSLWWALESRVNKRRIYGRPPYGSNP
jgi:hypothetical protein